jgi:23S rRNA (uracil1939-C5)-methyltransferase
VAHELKSGEIHEADVVDLAQDGRGIARAGGKAVFVDGALPGERIRLRVYKRRPTFDEAVLVEVLSASPDRVEPRCPHFGVCGGCACRPPRSSPPSSASFSTIWSASAG